MRIAIVSDSFAPLRTSAAVQIRDLAAEFIAQGHQPTVIIPAPDLQTRISIDVISGVEVLRVRSSRMKDVGYIRRTLAEFCMPFTVLRGLRHSSLATVKWDGIVWYSPSIFHGPLVKALKSSSRCRSYLILRDIFPEWSVDMGLMSRGLPYRFFKCVERYQYSAADVIGVQSAGNLAYFGGPSANANCRVEVLQNWLADSPNTGCSILIRNTSLAGRLIFVYAGNMGVAQGMDLILDLVERLAHRNDIGFLFVGRGSDSHRLRGEAVSRGLNNVVFCEEIAPSEMPGLYAQCHVGLVALDRRHRTHNIPGKFVSYMQCSLPVLACVNPGNDLVKLIEEGGVGRVCTDGSVDSIEALALALVADIAYDPRISTRCRALAARMFTPRVAVEQIVSSLKP